EAADPAAEVPPGLQGGHQPGLLPRRRADVEEPGRAPRFEGPAEHGGVERPGDVDVVGVDGEVGDVLRCRVHDVDGTGVDGWRKEVVTTDDVVDAQRPGR